MSVPPATRSAPRSFSPFASVLGIGDHRLGIGLELGLERFAERDRLGRDDVHQRAALKAGEDRRIDLLCDVLVVGQHHAPAGTAQGLVRRRRHHVGVAEGRWMLARGDQPREMRHVDEEQGANLVADRAEAREVEMARIGRAAGDDQLWPMLLREPFDLVEVDEVIVLAERHTGRR